MEERSRAFFSLLLPLPSTIVVIWMTVYLFFLSLPSSTHTHTRAIDFYFHGWLLVVLGIFPFYEYFLFLERCPRNKNEQDTSRPLLLLSTHCAQGFDSKRRTKTVRENESNVDRPAFQNIQLQSGVPQA